jgi:hypothetical protein
MRISVICLGWLLSCCLRLPALAQGADPRENLKQFSAFAQVDLPRLLAGDILSERGSLMDFPNGISAQLCFAVPATAAAAAERLQHWDPSRHESLKVHAFHELHDPCVSADFDSLSLAGKMRSVKWLVDKTRETTADKSELNLSRSEARELAACARTNPAPTALSACWARLLLARASAFQRQGQAGVPAYEWSTSSVSPVTQLRAMVLEQAAMAREFAPLLQQAGLHHSAVSPTRKPFYYWDLFEADHHGTLSLGARYRLAAGDHDQLLDEEYYVSGSYYTSITLYEIWPVRVGDTTGALVWRGDFLAAPTLAFTKGTERIAYGAIMIQEIKKEIRCFQDDLKSTR